ncbi:MAG: hypothetical protein JW802_03885 [Campylobacterales bacterium]|nr:hypothetical protein [Campylobacterales bacterium]
MGMLIGFFLLIYTLVAMGVYKITKRFSEKKWLHRAVLAIIFLIPTYDIIITNTLGAYHCLTTPSTYISKKVEYPESIYWEDNVYPGFSKEDRKLMVMNYLDGIHLKTMALNGEDGKIYTYETNASVWEELKPLEKDRGQPYYDRVNAIAQNIMETSEQIYTKETMPKMNYTVTFDEVKLNQLSSKFLYSDETKIIDNQTGETIAYNRRVMHFFYNAFPDLVQGDKYYWKEPVCGYKYPNFDEMFNYKRANHRGGIKHIDGLNTTLYNKYIKGEK